MASTMMRFWSVTGFVILLLTLWQPFVASAGSTSPNPDALANSASATLNDLKAVQSEFNAVLSKLARDAGFAKAFDEAAFNGDKSQMVALLKEGGMRRSTIEIEEIDKDIVISVKGCYKGLCITVKISW